MSRSYTVDTGVNDVVDGCCCCDKLASHGTLVFSTTDGILKKLLTDLLVGGWGAEEEETDWEIFFLSSK